MDLYNQGYFSGTFLPQVATETGWNKEEFLGHCARDKAGLGWDGWKDADIYIYEATSSPKKRSTVAKTDKVAVFASFHIFRLHEGNIQIINLRKNFFQDPFKFMEIFGRDGRIIFIT